MMFKATPIAAAVAKIIGLYIPAPSSTARAIACPVCSNEMPRLTVCPCCNGTKKIFSA